MNATRRYYRALLQIEASQREIILKHPKLLIVNGRIVCFVLLHRTISRNVSQRSCHNLLIDFATDGAAALKRF